MFKGKLGGLKAQVAQAEAAQDVELPTEASMASTNLLDYSLCLYGEKGIGKSSLASQFEDVALHMMWEPRRVDFAGRIVPKSGEARLDWLRCKAYLEKLQSSHKTPGRVVVDTLDLCARACATYWAGQLKVPSLLGLNDMGRGWDQMKSDWENTWAALLWSGWRVTVLSHARVRPKTVRGISRANQKEAVSKGVILNETQPTATGWAVDWTKVTCPLAVYFGWHGKDRVMFVRGSQRIYAAAGGVSDRVFLQKKGADGAGTPYDFIDMGHSPKEAYKILKDAWANKVLGYIDDTEVYENLPDE